MKMKLTITLMLVLTAPLAVQASNRTVQSSTEFARREARIENRFSRATKEKDIILLNCLGASLADIRNIHEIGVASLSGAVKAHEQENGDLEEHYLSKVKIVEKESIRILAESLLCVGSAADKAAVRVVLSEPEFGDPEDPGPLRSPETTPPAASPLD
jgi:hypothetical protein